MTYRNSVRVPKSNTFNYVNSPIIRVRVGEEPGATDFFVHQDLVILRSAFFRNAIDGDWKDPTDRVVPLPEDEADVFSMYMKLIYANKIPIKGLEFASIEPVADEYAMLSKLYVLAGKLMDETTKNVALAEMAARAAETDLGGNICCPPIDSVQTIYGGTSVDSQARQLIVRLYTDYGKDALLPEDVDALPKDFLFDLSRKNMDLNTCVIELRKELDTICPKPSNTQAPSLLLSSAPYTPGPGGPNTGGLFGYASTQTLNLGRNPAQANSGLFGGTRNN